MEMRKDKSFVRTRSRRVVLGSQRTDSGRKGFWGKGEREGERDTEQAKE